VTYTNIYKYTQFKCVAHKYTVYTHGECDFTEVLYVPGWTSLLILEQYSNQQI